MTPISTAVARGLKLGAVSVAVTAVLVLIGYVPTFRLAGPAGFSALLAGCGISLVGSLAGSLPVVLARNNAAPARTLAVLASTTLRFVVVVVLILAAALSGWFATAPLLIWAAISYLSLLVVDTLFALRLGVSSGPAQ